MDIVRISTTAAKECVRQHVGLDRVAMLLEGYLFAMANGISLDSVMTMARIIEPTNQGKFRTGAVTFINGGISSNPVSIPPQMVRLFSMIDDDTVPYEFVRAFELIHPFSDGNGRVGWVLYNYLSDTMEAPKELPDFHF